MISVFHDSVPPPNRLIGLSVPASGAADQPLGAVTFHAFLGGQGPVFGAIGKTADLRDPKSPSPIP